MIETISVGEFTIYKIIESTNREELTETFTNEDLIPNSLWVR